MTTARSGPHSRGPLSARLVDLVSGTGPDEQHATKRRRGPRGCRPCAASGTTPIDREASPSPQARWLRCRRRLAGLVWFEGPEYLAWVGEQPEADSMVLMRTTTYRVMSGLTQLLALDA